MNDILQFDFSILNFIYENIRCSFLDPVFAGLSYFGAYGIGWIVIGLLLLIPKKTRIWGIMALLAMALGALCSEVVIKHIFCRIRPYEYYSTFFGTPLPFKLNTLPESTYSFPSGHSCLAFASAVVYFKANKKWGTLALILAALIAFSRLYNYVHYPTDVLAGTILGIACAFAVIIIFSKNKKLRKYL